VLFLFLLLAEIRDVSDVCSIAGAVYDFLRYVHPWITVPHDGIKFSTPSMDHDVSPIFNCPVLFGGGWWHTFCALWGPTYNIPSWYSLGDDTFYEMKNIHIMIKRQ